ncbi:glutaconyl-CoA decarboxylase subunit beta [Phascolarctobacterium faecium]|uniref:sodium ion-translocating decarboxylase subunit beta n=2 Tax=Phascolarctobacterium faecium TaxID=33025 RepID=UPI001FCC8AB6|nr:sodium ion-translocating decarboxylase subunit beta [Phascolarctobacterium faecium]BDE85155.1 glutaconyl-CoA decarboxylase subunit beta [Phascolarctobacterium faecium]BDE94279.1 glutaconyl-CoA decarboxylase subunit beta [Phascolarctobacterium faecium]
MEAFVVALQSVWNDSGFSAFTMGNAIMMLVGIILLYLAIGKGFEPLLLSPIAFGCLLANVPKTGFEDQPGVMQVILYGIHHEIFPPLIFLGVGAMTDFGPLIANPKTLLLGAAAQAGVFISLLGAMMLGFTVQEASAIGIIGGADGPTAIYLAAKMAPNLLGAIAVAAYSYMSLVPLIQPPIMKLCTTEADRKIVMAQLRPVTRFEKIVFPIATTIVISLLLPPVTALIGMLMLGNLFKEAGCLDRLSDTAQNALMNIVTIMLATGTGLTMKAESFLNYQTILIICLGLVAFAAGTFAGVVFGKLMCILDGGKTNPLIGSAGVSAVPMAARVSQVVGQKANPSNFLLMHAMGPNVAGVIGTAVAAGAMLAMIGAAK